MQTFKSKVIYGIGLGKKLGFPTLNLVISKNLKIEEGVYVCDVLIKEKKYQAVMHYGKKNIGEKKKTWEIYVLDFKKEVYGEVVEVTVLDKLREVRNFKDITELKRQIKRDIIEARSRFC